MTRLLCPRDGAVACGLISCFGSSTTLMGANDGRAMGCWFAYADALSTGCFAGASAISTTHTIPSKKPTVLTQCCARSLRPVGSRRDRSKSHAPFLQAQSSMR
jgi:hypothetical protein